MRFLERRRLNAEGRLAAAFVHAYCCTGSRRLSAFEAAKAAKVSSSFAYRTVWRWLEGGWLVDEWSDDKHPQRFYRPTELGLRELGMFVRYGR